MTHPATMLRLFRQGFDTMQIAEQTGESESAVYNQIARARIVERLQKHRAEKYRQQRQYIKFRRCGYTREQALELCGTPTRSDPPARTSRAAQLGANALSHSVRALRSP